MGGWVLTRVGAEGEEDELEGGGGGGVGVGEGGRDKYRVGHTRRPKLSQTRASLSPSLPSFLLYLSPPVDSEAFLRRKSWSSSLESLSDQKGGGEEGEEGEGKRRVEGEEEGRRPCLSRPPTRNQVREWEKGREEGREDSRHRFGGGKNKK